jgi:aminobenzoyl-glutamate transport protein
MSGWGVVALMIPDALDILVAWIVLYAAWFLPGIPLGPDSPIKL